MRERSYVFFFAAVPFHHAGVEWFHEKCCYLMGDKKSLINVTERSQYEKHFVLRQTRSH